MNEGTNTEVAAAQRHIIERPRLTKLLDESTARIILLTAPAGYGKTTLARQWMADKPHVYYECGVESSDAAALAVGLAGAARASSPNAADRVASLVRVHAAVDHARLAAFLANELREWPVDQWLVIDDYHLVNASQGAEELIRSVATRVAMKIVIASRQRPVWVTERMLLYGEAFELTRKQMTMDTDEVGAALGEAGREVEELTGRSEGWPAVVGLAALAGHGIDGGEATSGLYTYLADELYARLTTDAQIALIALADSPLISSDLASAVFGPRGVEIVNAAVNAGFLVGRDVDRTYSMHPLLREFLRSKRGESPEATDAALAAAEWLAASERWDDAFTVATAHQFKHLMLEVLRAAADQLLRLGRSVTLRAWVGDVRRAGLADPILTLLESELAFREGDFPAAVSFATNAVQAIDPNDVIASRAWRGLGSATYFAENPEVATGHYLRALELAKSDDDRRDAIWGAFCSTAYRGNKIAYAFLDQFEKFAADDPRVRVRVATGQLQLASAFGRADDALVMANAAQAALVAIDDVMVRSSFLNIWATVLIANANYVAAEAVIDKLAAEAESGALTFVVPLLQIYRAGVEAGRGRFARASAILDRLERDDVYDDDIFVRLSVLRARARLSAVGHRHSRKKRADLATEAAPPGTPLATFAEYLAAEALFAVAQHDFATALELSERASAATDTVEASVDAAFVRAAASSKRRQRQEAATAFALAEETGIWDGFVYAYRVSPNIVEHATAHRALAAAVSRRTGDGTLARRLESRAPRAATQRATPLTARETEVLHLVAQGMRNDEIARALFVSPVTVKVHLRHVFEKLGVRSRTEAALRAQARELI